MEGKKMFMKYTSDYVKQKVSALKQNVDFQECSTDIA